jgi:acid stress-induced BolA-like protein IbaG/YrbA
MTADTSSPESDASSMVFASAGTGPVARRLRRGYVWAMSQHPTDFQGSVHDAIREAVEAAIAESTVMVAGGGGHYEIDVTAAAFAGKSLLQKQRMVLTSIKHLMAGDRAPVHAVDSIKTHVP